MENSGITLKVKSNLTKRIFATVLDYGLFLLTFYIYVLLLGHDNDEGGKTVDGFLVLPIPIAWFIYFILVEAYYGSTLGHQGLNLKVLTVDRREIDLPQALKRHLLDPFDILFWGIPAFIAIKYSEKHQRLGDMWASTIVVDTKDSEQY